MKTVRRRGEKGLVQGHTVVELVQKLQRGKGLESHLPHRLDLPAPSSVLSKEWRSGSGSPHTAACSQAPRLPAENGTGPALRAQGPLLWFQGVKGTYIPPEGRRVFPGTALSHELGRQSLEAPSPFPT